MHVHVRADVYGLFAEPVGDQRLERRRSPRSASGPLAVTRMQQPGLAASIIRPMIEVPPTVMPSFSTVMSASKPAGDLDEFRRGAGMQAALVDDQAVRG